MYSYSIIKTTKMQNNTEVLLNASYISKQHMYLVTKCLYYTDSTVIKVQKYDIIFMVHYI